MYVITGATGHTGQIIAQMLLEAGKKVRVLGRNADHLKALAARGAEPAVGDLTDADFVRKAFSGATAVYAMIPPSFTAKVFRTYQDAVGGAIADAAREAGVRSVVHLSSLGAEHAEGVGPIAGLHSQEERLNALQDLNVLHLRAGYFMENHLVSIGMIKMTGFNGSAVRSDLPIAMIASKDIGEYAAKRLLALDFKGKTIQELLGPRHVTMKEATTVLGRTIGRPDLSYREFPYEATRLALIGMGLSNDLAKLYVEMSRAFNEGRIVSSPRNRENTTSTTLEAFSETFAAAYRSS